MTDPRTAALAEALSMNLAALDDLLHGPVNQYKWENAAAAILAALPPDWCGHPVQVAKWREMGAEIARLRPIEEAARAYLSRPSSPALLAALRAALEKKP